METRKGDRRIPNSWWALALVVFTAMFMVVTVVIFTGAAKSYVPVTVMADRAGLVLENNAKVKMRGVLVGRVSQIDVNKSGATLQLKLDPDQVKYIPANVGAQVSVTTAFGAKFVDLVYPQTPSSARIADGTVLHAVHTTTEVDTVFENIVNLLDMVDPAKLNSVLSAVADGVRGQGERMGQATTDLNEVLTALNARSDKIKDDWRSFKQFNDTYGQAADNIVKILNAASTTSVTVTNKSKSLDSLLMNVIGFSEAGTDLLGPSKDNFVDAINTLEPTTNLLLKYSPGYTCWLEGTKKFLDSGAWGVFGGDDGRSLILDATLLPGKNPYVFPDNLPINGAKGGPGGKPGCGSLPDIAKNFPVRQLIANTGWGTGLDIRPNPGIGSPCYAQWFQTTRAVPEAPSVRQCLPGPAPGPIPYPGAPPYGAALYGPGGVPLWPGVPPAAPNPADAQPQSAPGPAAEVPPAVDAPALPAEVGGN
ncbi:MCE family protein [Mycolicibacterium llatzerense]|uniref:MCE-family protein MCE3A n=1 Tax=Mycolicibacterium llatzerense TaxID=280871 RepID=A0A0D1J2I7_9MYCO|nr:MCE family protein [Mycolicibacterium llatzerense]KIU15778.1 MCE-family protein MCE3A [Mycolicibacterium llatzerense]MCT7368647.1 MCE-family protein MCE3A [Mycolicibacterium llatzerense]